MRQRIMIVDADATLSRNVSAHLVRRNYDVTAVSTSEEALRNFRGVNPHLVLLDVSPASGNALEALQKFRHLRADVVVFVISGLRDPEMIFKCSKMGADDYLSKPFEPKDLEVQIAKALERAPTTSQVAPIRDQVRGQTDFSMLFGTSPRMEDVKMTIDKVADTNATVLIRGESGTGKEMVARMVYGQSGRREKPFVKVNCAAIPYELLESELFGYEQGAFTGANRQKLGKFDQASNGTIFLDEISEMHPALQAKLLHVLQDGEFARLGGKRDIAVDVRVLAATNKPLERAVEEGMFREDLFYRLNVVTIHIPPLRERREEIQIFLEFFLRKYSEYYGKNPPPFSDYAVGRMMEYAWPGNIRELENLVKRYVIVGNEAQIIRELSTHKPIVSSLAGGSRDSNGKIVPMSQPTVESAFQSTANGPLEMPSLLEIGRRAAMQAEREAIERVLAQTRWNRRQAAKILRVSYKALLNKLKAMEEGKTVKHGSEEAKVNSRQQPA